MILEATNGANQVVLKYDQPLYVFGNELNFSSYHEELSKYIKSKITVFK